MLPLKGSCFVKLQNFFYLKVLIYVSANLFFNSFFVSEPHPAVFTACPWVFAQGLLLVGLGIMRGSRDWTCIGYVQDKYLNCCTFSDCFFLVLLLFGRLTSGSVLRDLFWQGQGSNSGQLCALLAVFSLCLSPISFSRSMFCFLSTGPSSW